MGSRPTEPADGVCTRALNHGRTAVWPERPSQAWANLAGTRWTGRFDLEKVMQEAADYDAQSRFDAYTLAINPASSRVVDDD